MAAIGCAEAPSTSTALQAAVADLRFFDIALSTPDINSLYSEFSSSYQGYGTILLHNIFVFQYCN